MREFEPHWVIMIIMEAPNYKKKSILVRELGEIGIFKILA